MIKKIGCVALAASLALTVTGCNMGGQKSEPPALPENSVIEEVSPAEGLETIEDPGTALAPGLAQENLMNGRLEGLTRDQYSGLEISAVAGPDNILPGAFGEVTIKIRNTGDRPVYYVQGSGSYVIPEALGLHAEGLQPIISRDHLGAATLDFVTKELKPGDELEFTRHIMATMPHAEFDNWTHGRFFEHNQLMSDLTWEDLSADYPELTRAETGVYEGKVYFIYTLLEEGEDESVVVMQEPTGYAEADFTLSVQE